MGLGCSGEILPPPPSSPPSSPLRVPRRLRGVVTSDESLVGTFLIKNDIVAHLFVKRSFSEDDFLPKADSRCAKDLGGTGRKVS